MRQNSWRRAREYYARLNSTLGIARGVKRHGRERMRRKVAHKGDYDSSERVVHSKLGRKAIVLCIPPCTGTGIVARIVLVLHAGDQWRSKR